MTVTERMIKFKVHNYFKLLILSQRWWLVYNHVGQMISPTSTFHPPTTPETAAVCRLSVWMSVTLLPVYWTLVTNTITNTARVLVQKRSCVCVCVCLSCVWACVCASLRSWSRAPSPLRWERPSVEVENAFLFYVQITIRASFMSSLPKPFTYVSLSFRCVFVWL